MWRSWLARWWRPDAARPRPPARPDGALCRVVTWNIHHGADAWDHLDLDAVAAVLDACAADVVALQEVDRHWDERSDDVDQTAWLSERLGMHGIHGWTVRRVRRDRSADGRHGNALLSRQPWTGRQVTRFADVAGVERRGVVAGTTRTPLGPVRFVSAHLSTRHASLRSTEVGQLLTVVAKDRAAAVRTPVVVAGDFNAEPRNPELADLADTLTDACRGSRQGLGDTAPAAKPWRRTDHVWVGGLTAVGPPCSVRRPPTTSRWSSTWPRPTNPSARARRPAPHRRPATPRDWRSTVLRTACRGPQCASRRPDGGTIAGQLSECACRCPLRGPRFNCRNRAVGDGGRSLAGKEGI